MHRSHPGRIGFLLASQDGHPHLVWGSPGTSVYGGLSEVGGSCESENGRGKERGLSLSSSVCPAKELVAQGEMDARRSQPTAPISSYPHPFPFLSLLPVRLTDSINCGSTGIVGPKGYRESEVHVGMTRSPGPPQ